MQCTSRPTVKIRSSIVYCYYSLSHNSNRLVVIEDNARIAAYILWNGLQYMQTGINNVRVY